MIKIGLSLSSLCAVLSSSPSPESTEFLNSEIALLEWLLEGSELP
jgi:hypothetical protein